MIEHAQLQHNLDSEDNAEEDLKHLEDIVCSRPELRRRHIDSWISYVVSHFEAGIFGLESHDDRVHANQQPKDCLELKARHDRARVRPQVVKDVVARHIDGCHSLRLVEEHLGHCAARLLCLLGGRLWASPKSSLLRHRCQPQPLPASLRHRSAATGRGDNVWHGALTVAVPVAATAAAGGVPSRGFPHERKLQSRLQLHCGHYHVIHQHLRGDLISLEECEVQARRRAL
mmetsp:Transcript_61661/g.144603  ORF Transcript_61661/g.144603 Transcript_61661/m.144603 type:complete len:230 (+) Transcript_61661:1000-1689(+)